MKITFKPLLIVVPLLLACAVLSTPAPTATPPAVEPTAVGPTAVAATASPLPPVPSPTEPALPPSPTPAPISLRVAVSAGDGSVKFVDTGFVGSPALLYQGLPPRGGAAGAVLYALNFDNLPLIERIDSGGRQPLDFGQPPNTALAVWPGNENELARLAFGTSPIGERAHTQIFIAAVDGSSLVEAIVDARGQGEPPYEFQAQRWSADGQSLYFSREPYGIGGYILFNGASSLFRYDLAADDITPLIPFDLASNVLCLGDLNIAVGVAVGNCTDRTVMTVYDLDRDSENGTILPPAELTDFTVLGSARFSPDAARVAFALARGNPESEQGWVAVSDGMSGASRVVASANPGSYYTVIGWLDASTLLLQQQTMNCADVCPPSLWTVGADGSGLTQLAEGLYLSFVAGQ